MSKSTVKLYPLFAHNEDIKEVIGQTTTGLPIKRWNVLGTLIWEQSLLQTIVRENKANEVH